MSTPVSARRSYRFVPFLIFIIIAICLFVGGGAAVFHLIFSEYSGVKNIWLLLCGTPFVLVVLAMTIVVRLYTRFGKPLDELFNAINAVEEGNLSVRVSENKSDMFSDLIKRFNKM